MSKNHTTVKDIAEKTGLHYSTVSRALRDYSDINEKTKRKVLMAARELNYTPNTIAQGLKSRTTKQVGIIIPEIDNNFFSRAVSQIEKVIYDHGFVPIVLQTNESPEREVLNIDSMLSNRIAGLIISVSENTEETDHLLKLTKNNIPLVLLDRVIKTEAANKVISNEKQGAKEGVEYLISKGHKRIAHFAGPEHSKISRQKMEGYIEALKENSRRIEDDLIIFGDLKEESGYQAMDELLNKDIIPDAIFTVNDLVANGAIKRIREEELSIPQDIAILGFSNNDISQYFDPPLTTIEKFPGKMGKVAAEILVNQIGQEEISTKTEVLPTKLIIRKSA